MVPASTRTIPMGGLNPPQPGIVRGRPTAPLAVSKPRRLVFACANWQGGLRGFVAAAGPSKLALAHLDVRRGHRSGRYRRSRFAVSGHAPNILFVVLITIFRADPIAARGRHAHQGNMT